MKKQIVVLLAVLLTGAVFAAENLQVIARGMGKDAASATKDALVQAVQQAVGAMVDSETLMKNDAILKEQVLTFSDGFVSKYEVLKAPAPNKYGLYETTIRAQVEQKKLRGKLAETRILKIEVKDAQNIWAKLETEQLRKENAETMLLKIFSMLNPKDFLIPTLVDPQKRMGKDAKLNVFRKDGKMYISMGILVAFDHKKYVREVQPYLLDALNKLCLDKSGPWQAPAKEWVNGLKIRFETENGRKEERFGSTYSRKNAPNTNDRRSSYVFVNSSKSNNPRFQSFVVYRFPRWEGPFRKKITNIFRRRYFAVFTLKDAAGEIILQEEIQIMGTSGEKALCWESQGKMVFISPEFISIARHVSPVHVYGFTCEIKPDQLKDIKTIELTIKEKAKR
ncbi:MAG: hypothetical protein E7055_00420 [Lentisphaerae bacterium]|nr:hypothetical protein [Lentisphaerota bacterium]